MDRTSNKRKKRKKISRRIVKRLVYLGILLLLCGAGAVFFFCSESEMWVAGLLIFAVSLIGFVIDLIELLIILFRKPQSGRITASTVPHDESDENATPYLRITGPVRRSKTLLEATVEVYHIVYRRIGRTNELVINGRVYDEWKGLIETEHELHAAIEENTIAVGLDKDSFAYILFNGERIAQTMRSI